MGERGTTAYSSMRPEQGGSSPTSSITASCFEYRLFCGPTVVYYYRNAPLSHQEYPYFYDSLDHPPFSPYCHRYFFLEVSGQSATVYLGQRHEFRTASPSWCKPMSGWGEEEHYGSQAFGRLEYCSSGSGDDIHGFAEWSPIWCGQCLSVHSTDILDLWANSPPYAGSRVDFGFDEHRYVRNLIALPSGPSI